MVRPISRLFKFLCFAILLKASAISAQEDLVRVSIRPDHEEWDWQPYAEKLSLRLATAIDSRVNEGFPRREFTLDSLATTLEFRFRIDIQGRLRRFAPLLPKHRYLAYLIQRTARELGAFDPLPDDLPLFYFDGTMRFNCRMKPTGMYKRLYFEEPLDTLQKIAVTPVYKTTKSSQPLMLYEPQTVDKNKLLEDFKQRIGIVEEISDTSSYTPLDFTNRAVTVQVEYDSLTGSKFESEMLKTRIEAALLEAGARLTESEFIPPQPPVLEIAEAEEDSALYVEPPDTSSKEPQDTVPEEKPAVPVLEIAEAEEDSTLYVEPPDTSSKEPQETVPEEKPAVLELERDLAAAFASRLDSTFLVFSAGVAADTVLNKAVCRVQLFPSDNPGQLKRQVDYTFAHSGTLPDSLGRMIVARFTTPPPKPKPPAKPKPKPKAPVARAAGDSTSADTTAAAKAARVDSAAVAPADTTTAAEAIPTPAKVDTSGAAPDSAAAAIVDSTTIPVDSLAPAEVDTTGAAPDTTKKQPQAAPAPADTSSAIEDTTGQGAPSTPEPPAEAASDTAEAAQDTTAKTPGESP